MLKKRVSIQCALLCMTLGVFTVNAQEKAWVQGSEVGAGKYILYNTNLAGYMDGGFDSWGTCGGVYKNPRFFNISPNGSGWNIDTEINNGGEQHYMQASVWLDGSAVAQTFDVLDAETHLYKIGNGGNWFGGTRLGDVVTFAPSPNNASWLLLSEDDYKGMLAAHTYDGQTYVNATALIQGARTFRNFTNGIDKDGNWLVSYDAGTCNLNGGSNAYRAAEFYNNTFSIEQTLENVPNGKYVFSVQGFQRINSGMKLAKIFANDKEELMMLRSEGDNPEVNSMADAAQAMAGGDFDNNVVAVLVTDHTLRLGLKKEAQSGDGTDWVIFNNFSLFYYGEPSNPVYENFSFYLRDMQETCSDWQDADGNYLYSVANVERYTMLTAQAAALDERSSDEDLNGLADKMKELTVAVKIEKRGYNRLLPFYTKVKCAAQNYGRLPQTGGEITGFCQKLESALSQGTYDPTSLEVLKVEYTEIIEKVKDEVPTNITEGMDITILVDNPDFDNNSSDGWIVETGQWTNIAAECAEMYQKNFDVYQELTGLPSGRYEVKLQGFVRQGYSDESFARYTAGTEDIKAYIYSESGGVTVKTPFRSIYDGKSETQVFFNQDGLPEPVGLVDKLVTDRNGNQYYVPNGMAGFAAYEALGDDRYATTATLLVVDGTLRFGAACDDYTDEGFWCIFDSFRLTYVSEDWLGVLKVMYGKDMDALVARRDEILAEQLLPPSICKAIDALRTELETTEDLNVVKNMPDRIEALRRRLESIAAGEVRTFGYTIQYSADKSTCTIEAGLTSTGSVMYWTDSEGGEPRGEFVDSKATITFPEEKIGKEDAHSGKYYFYEIETDDEGHVFVMATSYAYITLSDPTLSQELCDADWAVVQELAAELDALGDSKSWDLSQGKGG